MSPHAYTEEIVVTDNMTAQGFSPMIQPMLVEQATIGIVIRNLRRTRNLLLPRLLSGKIDLEGANSNLKCNT